MGRGLGIDISDYSIEALELKKNWGQFKVAKYARREIKTGLAEDGKILEVHKLAQELKELLNAATPQPIKHSEVVLSLPESQVYIHLFKFPLDLDNNKINEAIKYQLPEVIPFNLDEIYFTWRLNQEGATEQEILVAAVSKEILDQYLELLKLAELKPLAFTLESLSTARAVLPETDNQQAYCLLDLGARTSLISIFDGHGLRYSYNFPQAGKNLTERLVEELKISFTEAEKIKMKNGLDPKAEPHQAGELLEKALKPLIQEVKKSIDFYEFQNNQELSKIVLTGGTSLLNKFTEYLSGILEIPVVLGQPLAKIKKSDIIKPNSEEIFLANVTGSALWSLDKKYQKQSLNLLP